MNLLPLPHLHRLPRLPYSSTRPTFKPYLPILRQKRHFHPSRRKEDDFPNHYKTLDLPSSATGPEIKKQFYALSKQYHPDMNPDDPSASSRFVKISEAYHTLGSAEKKSKYDRDFHRAHAGRSARGHMAGSYHSSSSPAGGRPASGLSKRRGTFRGPPPSFYSQGGYGTTSSKRSRAQASADASGQFGARASPNHPSGLGSQPRYQGTGGADFDFDPDPTLPYFDKASHRRTHDNLGARRDANAEARRPAPDPYASVGDRSGNMVANFFIVSAVVAFAMVAAEMLKGSFTTTRPGGGERRGGKREVRENG